VDRQGRVRRRRLVRHLLRHGPRRRRPVHPPAFFVGIDEDRPAVPTPHWEPASDEDRALDAHAPELVDIRDRFGAERPGGGQR